MQKEKKYHLDCRVYGDVQGVFFRARVKDMADKLGLKGLVKNESEETVYLEAEGERKKIKELIKFCQKGPKLAVVDRLEFYLNQRLKNFKNFKIIIQ